MIQHPTDPRLFTISADIEARLLKVKISKLWDEETFNLYSRALVTEMKRFKDAGLSFDIIGDLTESPPQHQYLNAARQELDEVVKEMGVRKNAVVAAGAIVKYQVGRLSQKSYNGVPYRFFATEAEAMAWIEE